MITRQIQRQAGEMLALKRKPRVRGPCPAQRDAVPTHARMRERELQAFRGTLAYWCSSCATAHKADHAELSLEVQTTARPSR